MIQLDFRSAIVFAAFVLVTSTAHHAEDAKGRMIVKWTDPTRPGLVRVNMLSGSLTVRTHPGLDVIVESPAIGKAQDGILLDERNNVLTLSSRTPFGGDIEIRVPSKTNLSLYSSNGGAILVDGVDGEIEVSNNKGNVTLSSVAGSVIAHAMKGNLSATLKEVAPNKPLSFSSMNGNVTVTLPQSLKATVKLHSDHGIIFSDFDITIPARRGGVIARTNKTIVGAINGGGIDLEVRALNGNINLQKGK